eukprot:COSAG02_NODE_10050_length_2038_cov_2.056215_1_plen_218_part_00
MLLAIRRSEGMVRISPVRINHSFQLLRYSAREEETKCFRTPSCSTGIFQHSEDYEYDHYNRSIPLQYRGNRRIMRRMDSPQDEARNLPMPKRSQLGALHALALTGSLIMALGAHYPGTQVGNVSPETVFVATPSGGGRTSNVGVGRLQNRSRSNVRARALQATCATNAKTSAMPVDTTSGQWTLTSASSVRTARWAGRRRLHVRPWSVCSALPLCVR